MSADRNRGIRGLVFQARREQILDAACQVFAEKGFQRATIREVADSAGIAAGTIYNYFKNKNGLLLGILDRLNETEQRVEMLTMDLDQFFGAYLRHRFAALSGTGLEAFKILVSEMLVNPEIRALYNDRIARKTFALAEKQFARLVDEGKIRALDVPLMVRAVAGSFIGLLVLRIMGDDSVQKGWEEGLPEVLTTLLIDGLRKPGDK